ncbi:adrenocorticotropic hormone receptor-like [Oculina patagonica]
MSNASGPTLDFYLTLIDDRAYWRSLAVFGYILAFVIIVGNAILLFVTFKDPRKSLRLLPPVLLITNLSASDFLLGLLNVFLVALRDVYRSRLVHMPFVLVFKAIMYTVLSTTLFVSSYSIIAMSITCYVAISKPVEYKSIITRRRLKIFIALLWFVSIGMCGIPVTNIPERTYTLIYLHTHASLPAILLTVMYVKVFQALVRQTRELQLGEYDSIASYARRRERKMAISIIIVLALFYITYLPQFVTLHLLYFCKPCQQSITFHKIDVALSRFLFINSAINPFIYAWRIPNYRRALYDCWPSCFGKLRVTPRGSVSNSWRRTSAQSAGESQGRFRQKTKRSQSQRIEITGI